MWELAEDAPYRGDQPRNRTLTCHVAGIEVNDGAVTHREMVPVAIWSWGSKLYAGFSPHIKGYRLRVVETSPTKVTMELVPDEQLR